MASKKKDSGEGLIYLSLVLFIPFLLFSYMRYSLINDSHLKDESTIRIIDFSVINRVLFPSGFCMLLLFLTVNSVKDNFSFGGFLFVLLLIVIALLLSLRLAVVYAGVLINDNKDKISFPPDFKSFSITDYFSKKIIESFFNIDEVKLSDITKMTREAGKYLYIHGKFGSRKLVFSSKQKRDECIATIQDTANFRGEKIREIGFAE